MAKRTGAGGETLAHVLSVIGFALRSPPLFLFSPSRIYTWFADSGKSLSTCASGWMGYALPAYTGGLFELHGVEFWQVAGRLELPKTDTI